MGADGRAKPVQGQHRAVDSCRQVATRAVAGSVQHGAMILKDRLNAFLRHHFRLDWDGIHGAAHWARVLRYGRHLAEGSGADDEVIMLFALLHDSCREDDNADPGHGPRAALLVRELNGHLFRISREQEELLVTAVEGHSRGGIGDDLSVRICWDADRLDLGRLGMAVRAHKLGTPRAQALIARPWPYWP